MSAGSPSHETLVHRLLPGLNRDPHDRASAWDEWQRSTGLNAVTAYIRSHNYSSEPDEDILQESLVTAYLEVERGRYQQRDGVPFTAYVKGIAHNKIREAHRRQRHTVPLDDVEFALSAPAGSRPEAVVEQREQHAAVRASLGQLPAAHRAVLDYCARGHSTAEIARMLNIKESLVRQHKSRGIRGLRRLRTSHHN